MKKLLYAVLFVSLPIISMELEADKTPEYLKKVPKEIWAQIFNPLLPVGTNNDYREMRSLKLVSKFFYALMDSRTIHKLVSPDYITSTLILNTKEHRKKFDDHFFKADYRNLFWVFQNSVRFSVAPIIKKTLERGVDPNQWYGFTFKTTALCAASDHNDVEVARILLAHPLTDPNAPDEFDETPLTLSAKKNHAEILKLLLKHPMIDTEKKNRANQTALEIALNNHHQTAANIIIHDLETRRPHSWREQYLHLCTLCDPTNCTIS